MNARKVFPSHESKTSDLEGYFSMNDYDEARKAAYSEVRSHWIDIVDNYN